MKFTFDDEKNARLRTERNVRFEDAILAIAENRILAEFSHPDQDTYSGQRIMVLEIEDYAYCVPYRKLDDNTRLLITMYPNRKFKHLIEKEQTHESI